MKHILLLFTLILFIVTLAEAQLPQAPGAVPGLAGSGMVNYVFTKPGDLPIHVSVWGSVRQPGRYEIPDGTTLAQLLSLAGGPGFDTRGFAIGTDQYGARQYRGRTHIRLSRDTPQGVRILLESRIDHLLSDNIRNMSVHDGDIIMVDMVRSFNLWDALLIVSSSASVILLMDRIFTIF
jgi:hypothetical protein